MINPAFYCAKLWELSTSLSVICKHFFLLMSCHILFLCIFYFIYFFFTSVWKGNIKKVGGGGIIFFNNYPKLYSQKEIEISKWKYLHCLILFPSSYCYSLSQLSKNNQPLLLWSYHRNMIKQAAHFNQFYIRWSLYYSLCFITAILNSRKRLEINAVLKT